MSDVLNSEPADGSATPESSPPAAPEAPASPAARAAGGQRPAGARGDGGGPGRGGRPGGGRPGGGRPGGGRGGGGRPGGGRGRGGGRRGEQDRGEEPSEFDDVVVKVYRCATVVKGGRRFSFAALVVVGDRKGRVGVGYGKANEVPSAVEKATKAARRDVVTIKLAGTTLPHQVIGRYGASHVVCVPAAEGTGVIAGASVRAVMELAGVKDVLTKSYGSNSPKNLVKATFAGLTSLRSKQDVARLREVSIA